jgi:acetyl esterase/lipase
MGWIHLTEKSMTGLLATLLILLLALVAIHAWLARCEDLGVYDHPVDQQGGDQFELPSGPSTGHRGVVAAFEAKQPEIAGLSPGGMIRYVRDLMEAFPEGKSFECRFVPIDDEGIRGEWVVAPGADPSRRVLYLHGGAFFAGSPNSHRTITQRFSELAGAAVFAVDYRLKPEHRRKDSIADCRSAYTWLLENGPDGPAPAARIFLGGDSAGGNLALMLSAWSRDRGLRKPDAVVAFSPLTDCTFRAPSIHQNAETDTFVRPLFGSLLGVPRMLIPWIVLSMDRMRPANPDLSPVHGDLSDLPPTLVQASESEMLFDDARRYVNKARDAGSPAFLQTWPGLLHVWQLFNPEVPEAGAAFKRVGEFLEKVENGQA